ncbi:hypothetical protein CTheo_3444 [Ceratobasidium theobromae]|uniref:Uncharacterized protein n=1 Tax=Ceratobasidium theobromae TaxID=1582974 RepID=A0A5N5QMX8_9AGAM|nr:hypothetical protein CTheo_3444 [Ceratobasidium theobromae]
MPPTHSDTSMICCDDDRFDRWAQSVKLGQERRDDLPNELKNLLAETQKIPRWMADENAEQYKMWSNRYGPQIQSLANGTSVMLSSLSGNTDPQGTTEQGDTATELDPFALHMIFSMSQGTAKCHLYPHNLKTNEAEFRCMFDFGLGNLVFRDEDNLRSTHLLERRLQLPYSKTDPQLVEIKVDSLAIFCDTNLVRSHNIPPHTRRVYQSLAGTNTHHFIFHWVTEYEQANRIEEAIRRTKMAMMEVMAGRWVRKQVKPLTPNTTTSQLAKNTMESVGIPAGPDTTQSQHGFGMKRKRGEENEQVKPEYEIAIYPLGTYAANDPFDLVQLYLLMKASRKLAYRYADEMFPRITKEMLWLKVEKDPAWPAPKPPKGGHQSQLATGDDPWEQGWDADAQEYVRRDGRGQHLWLSNLKERTPDPSEKVNDYFQRCEVAGDEALADDTSEM